MPAQGNQSADSANMLFMIRGATCICRQVSAFARSKFGAMMSGARSPFSALYTAIRLPLGKRSFCPGLMRRSS